MEFAFSEEQQELASTVRSLLDRRADPRVDDYDQTLWKTLCEQIGVAALGIPEEYDGVGAAFFETAIVLEELGRCLAPSPFLATAVATEALLAGGSEEAKGRLLPRIAAGEIATVALDVNQVVLDADRAEIVLAVVGDDLVEVAHPETEWAESMDQTIRLGYLIDPTDYEVIGDGRAARGRAELVGAAGVTALQAGLAARALEMTVSYSKERVQFGRPIGSFQALKHRMADMLVLLEMSRSASWAASYAVSRWADNAEDLTHVAKAYCGDALKHIAAETVQLHGGIAITWEHDAHLVLKRAHALGHLFGASGEHRAMLAL